MEICGDGHEDICYEGISCPLCAELESHIELQDELQNKIDRLTEELADAKR